MTPSRKSENTLRKARTRTLIQVGSLVNLAGLFEVCGIEEGDDLQLDITSRDKAANLLGILTHVMDTIASSPSQSELNKWKETGIMMLKKTSAKHYHHDRSLYQF